MKTQTKEYSQIATYKPFEVFRYGDCVTDGNFMIPLSVCEQISKKPNWLKEALINPNKMEGKEAWKEFYKEDIVTNDSNKAAVSSRAQIESYRVLVALQSENNYSIIQLGFYKFFRELFPYCEFFISGKESPVFVANSQALGLFMPICTKTDYSWIVDETLTNTEILMYALGWTGGTIHQLKAALNLDEIQISTATPDQMRKYVRLAHIHRNKELAMAK